MPVRICAAAYRARIERWASGHGRSAEARPLAAPTEPSPKTFGPERMLRTAGRLAVPWRSRRAGPFGRDVRQCAPLGNEPCPASRSPPAPGVAAAPPAATKGVRFDATPSFSAARIDASVPVRPLGRSRRLPARPFGSQTPRAREVEMPQFRARNHRRPSLEEGPSRDQPAAPRGGNGQPPLPVTLSRALHMVQVARETAGSAQVRE